MIDEKKIEEAAVEQLENLGTYGLDEVDLGKEQLVALYREEDVKAMFRAGINWFLENLWHDASEEPKVAEDKYCVTCLIKFKNGSVDLGSYFPSLEDKWVYDNMNYKDFLKNFDSWLYIEDLMKGGKK